MIGGNRGPRRVCKVKKDSLLEEETFDWRTEGRLGSCSMQVAAWWSQGERKHPRQREQVE